MIERPAERYGRQPMSQRTRRWLVIGLTALVVVLGVGVAIVGYQRLGTAAVQGEMGGYQVLDNRTVEVTVSVTRQDPSQPAVCILRARSLDGSETGRREVLVPPSSETVVQVRTTVTTSQPPLVGDVYGCGMEVPDYLIAP